MSADKINHPSHYTVGRIEVIDAIEGWGLGFRLGNVVKYVARSAYKGNALEDLKKAAWYLAREIAALEKATLPTPDPPKISGGLECMRRLRSGYLCLTMVPDGALCTKQHDD